jgi:hypothetical protein
LTRCLDRFFPGNFFLTDFWASWALGMVGVIESIATPVTDEVSIHILAKARFEPNDFTIAGARDGVAS